MTSHGSPHLDDETLFRLACEEVDGDERTKLLDHLDACDECGVIWQAVQQVRREAATFDPGALPRQEPALRRSRAPWWFGLAAAAAAALAAVVIGPSWFGPDEPTEPRGQVVRSVADPTPGVVSPSESEQVTEPGFAWQLVEGATDYTVELLDAEAAVLWTGEGLKGLNADWPASVEPTPGRYYWRVIAHLDDRTQVATPLVSFELASQ